MYHRLAEPRAKRAGSIAVLLPPPKAGPYIPSAGERASEAPPNSDVMPAAHKSANRQCHRRPGNPLPKRYWAFLNPPPEQRADRERKQQQRRGFGQQSKPKAQSESGGQPPRHAFRSEKAQRQIDACGHEGGGGGFVGDVLGDVE